MYKMRLILLRHGESLYNKMNKLAGWSDIALTEYGKEESKRVGNKFKNMNINFNYIFTSNLCRTIETSNIIINKMHNNDYFNLNKDKNHCNMITKSSVELNAKNYGSLTDKNVQELEEIFGIEKMRVWRKSYWINPPNGESLNDVSKRCGVYFDNEIRPLIYQGNNILIVSHSSTIKSLLVYLSIKNENNIEYFNVPNCKPIEIDIYDKSFKYID